jgi:pimeloyl-ACP methyl ester carboxylesterase
MWAMRAGREPPRRRPAAPSRNRLRIALLAAVVALGACVTQPGGIRDAASAPAPTVSCAGVDVVLDGRRTRAQVCRPGGTARAAVVLAHGFTRSRATMAGHARMLAGEGLLAVAPDLPYLVDSRDNARAVADLVAQLRAGSFAPPLQRVVLIGFSAGGLAALLACATPGVVGYIGLDPFDRPGGIGRAFAAGVQIPAALLRAPPSACNAYSIAGPWARAFARLEVDRLFDGATHCDFEAPSDVLCRLACGAPDPARQQAIRDEMVRLVRLWLGG